MSGWTMFTICFTTLLVGMWVAVTVFEFYHSNRKMEAAELSVRAPARVRGRNI